MSSIEKEKIGDRIISQIAHENFVSTAIKFSELRLNGLESLTYIGLGKASLESLLGEGNHSARFCAHLNALPVSEEGVKIVTNAISKLNDAANSSLRKLGIEEKASVEMFVNILDNDYLKIDGITRLEAKILFRLMYVQKADIRS